MAANQYYPWPGRVPEPPRDGEFGFQAEHCSEEPHAGLFDVFLGRMIVAVRTAGQLVLRYPVVFVSLAIGVGVIISSLIMNFPPAS